MQLLSLSPACGEVQLVFLQGSVCRRNLCPFGHVVLQGAILPAGNERTGEESPREAERVLLCLQQPMQRERAELRCLHQRSQPLVLIGSSRWPNPWDRWRGRNQAEELQLRPSLVLAVLCHPGLPSDAAAGGRGAGEHQLGWRGSPGQRVLGARVFLSGLSARSSPL